MLIMFMVNGFLIKNELIAFLA